MTYEWGYTYGPPMAVAPLPSVRRVVEFALTEMPPEKDAPENGRQAFVVEKEEKEK